MATTDDEDEVPGVGWPAEELLLLLALAISTLPSLGLMLLLLLLLPAVVAALEVAMVARLDVGPLLYPPHGMQALRH